MISDYAIKVEGLSRGYGNFKVLDNINFQIKQGSICALIGPSGSGKTTIIKSLLGKLCPDEGRVLVFDKEPYGSIDFDYPGSLLGYAPQELALYEELTICEVLEFYSNIHFMNRDSFIQSRDSIIQLLDLPNINRIIGTLSGGQKRRVSLAVALIHQPKLLYLDEPTVGIDPVVSKRIWQHLNYLSKQENVTVLITTHYLEETRQADNILLLRENKIIESGNPIDLLEKYKCQFLEEVYIKVCVPQSINMDQLEIQDQDGCDIQLDTINSNNNETLVNSGLQDISISTNNNIQTNQTNIFNIQLLKKKLNYSYSILKRSLLSCVRIKLVLILVILSPVILSCLFFLTIGGQPHGIKIGVLNNDSGIYGESFIEELYKRSTFKVYNISNTITGMNKVKNGQIYGYFEIPSNFTNGLVQRFFSPSDPTLPDSEIIPYLDQSNSQIHMVIMSSLQDIFIKLSNDSGVKIYPISDSIPIYEGGSDFTWFLGPAIIPTMIFAHIMFFIEIGLIRDRNCGSLDRLYSYGVTPFSVVLGYIGCACIILFIQNSILLIIGHFAFNVPIMGNIVLVYLYLYLIEMVGVYYGILFFNYCKDEFESSQVSLVIFFSIFFLSGTIWPIESMPNWFQWVSYIIPSSWAWVMLRGIMVKGLQFTHSEIWKSLLVVLSWNIVLFIISFKSISFREKNNKLINKFNKRFTCL